MSTETSATATAWIGWHRTAGSSRWRPIVQAETEAAAFEKLLDAVAGGDKIILVQAIDPNHKSATIRRRCF